MSIVVIWSWCGHCGHFSFIRTKLCVSPCIVTISQAHILLFPARTFTRMVSSCPSQLVRVPSEPAWGSFTGVVPKFMLTGHHRHNEDSQNHVPPKIPEGWNFIPSTGLKYLKISSSINWQVCRISLLWFYVLLSDAALALPGQDCLV